MMPPKKKLSLRIFGFIASLVLRAPWWVVCVYVVLTAASLLSASRYLEMQTDQNSLVSADLPYNQRFIKFLEDFGDLEFLYVVVIVDGHPERAMRVADLVNEEVGALTEHVENVFHRVPADSFGDSALLLAPRADLEGLVAAVEGSASLLERLGRTTGFASLLDLFAASMESAGARGDEAAAEMGFRFMEIVLDAVRAAAKGEPVSPLAKEAERAGNRGESRPLESGYLFSQNLELLFVEILPIKDFTTLEVIEEPLSQIRAALERVHARFPEVQFGLTGRPVLQADEMKTTNEDMTKSGILAFVGVLGLFILFFKRVRRPFLASLVLLVAIAITFGVVTLTIGYLTLLSIVFAVMLVGLGVDFGVVLVARYQDELIATQDIEASIRTTLLSTGMGVWTGALTTGCAFFSSIFVDFKGLQELGFVAGVGLLICLVCMLTLLPSLLVISDRRIQRRRALRPPHPVTVPFLAHAARHPRATLVAFALLTGLGLPWFQGIPYSSNLLDLQAKGLESVDYELKIIEKSDRSTWFCAFTADSLEAVDRIVRALEPAREAGVLGVVESIRDFVPAAQEETIQFLERAHGPVASLRIPAAAPSIGLGELKESLAKLLDGLDRLQSLAASRGSAGDAEAVKALQALVDRVEAIEEALEKDPDGVLERLGAAQVPWFLELEALRARYAGMLAPAPLTVESIHHEIARRFVSLDRKKFLVYAYPKKDIWQEQHMEEYVDALRRVDPDVTGAPVQVFESSRLMHEGFLLAALYSFILVFILLLVDFRSLKLALVTIIPVAVGVFWTLELMPIIGWSFNLANFFALPIMIGCGVDAGVHMVHRFRETRSVAEVGRTTGSAVTLANLSNMVGFASMGIARHQGVASLGLVTALGCFTVLVASVVLLPCFLELLKGRLLPKDR